MKKQVEPFGKIEASNFVNPDITNAGYLEADKDYISLQAEKRHGRFKYELSFLHKSLDKNGTVIEFLKQLDKDAHGARVKLDKTEAQCILNQEFGGEWTYGE